MKLEVYDRSLIYQGEVDDFDSGIITRPYRGHGQIEMTVALDSENAPLLQKYNWIYAGPRRVYQILYREVDTEDEDMLHIIGMAGGMAWAKRCTLPQVGQAYHIVTGSRDMIAKAYITANAVNPTNPTRIVPHIAVAASQAGEVITDQSRLQCVRDEVERVLASDDMGYYWDLIDGKVVFDTYKGSDRTDGQGILPPAIFALKYDNLISRRYVDSDMDTQNVIIVGGQGEGVERTIIEVGEATGDSRFEGFQDARDTDEEDELIDRAKSNMRATVESMEATVDAYGSLTYEQDFFLGDVVTVIDEKLGKKLDTRITEVREICQKDIPDNLEITYGNTIPTDLHSIARQGRQIGRLEAI